MVEINNQRKAFLDMLAWSEGTDNGRQKTRNHGYDVIVGGELFTVTPITLANLSAKPKTQINRRRTLLLSRWWDAYGNGLKTSLRKVRTLWHCQQIGRGALPMIDRGDIRQAIDRALISGLHCRALVMVSSSIRLTAWCKIQRSGRNVQRMV